MFVIRKPIDFISLILISATLFRRECPLRKGRCVIMIGVPTGIHRILSVNGIRRKPIIGVRRWKAVP